MRSSCGLFIIGCNLVGTITYSFINTSDNGLHTFKYDANGNMTVHNLEAEQQVCSDASNIIISRITRTSASITSTNTEQTYDLFVVKHGNTGPSPASGPNRHGANDIRFPYSSRVASTIAYDVYIRTQCSATETTDWIGPFLLPLEPGDYHYASEQEVNQQNTINRNLYWDEVNRLRTVVDNQTRTMHHYIYDADGQRVLKGSGGIEGVYQNGTIVHENIWMGNYKMYPSGYTVLDANGTLTKHYYNGSERIASKIADGRRFLGKNGTEETNIEVGNIQMDVEQLQKGIAYIFLQDIAQGNQKMQLKFIPQDKQQGLNQRSAPRDEIYYFHPDHLGTATYLSDANGNPYQFFLNLPFGETMAEQRTGAFENQYKFNGKELDQETGYYYYGARYYNPQISTWLSVDPHAERYPSLSGYSAFANNPINIIDPDGRDIIPVHGTWSSSATWGNLSGIRKASNNLFSDNKFGEAYDWSGDNFSGARTDAAIGLIDHVRTQMKSKDFNGEITLVGHSHGGNVSIEALNMMAEMEEFNDVELNLLTINTPVRDDYQLSENALERVNHVNVYDEKDPVQSNGGNSTGNKLFGVYIRGVRTGHRLGQQKGSGELGDAGRTFDNAQNINVDNPQGVGGDFHNSHNRTNDWIDKTENK